MATSTLSRSAARKGVPNILLKTIMAVTGLMFVGYVLVHMYGNLQILLGHEAFDNYAHHLRTIGEPMLPERMFLWIFRLVMLAAVVLHVWSAFTLWGRAGKARTQRYAAIRSGYGNFYAKAMRWGGVALLLFVVFHLLHLTTQTITVDGAHASPAVRVVTSFQHWWVVLIYALALVALGMHLLHGIWGACMTLGLNTSLKRAEQIRLVAILVATIVIVGFLIPPLAILFGIID